MRYFIFKLYGDTKYYARRTKLRTIGKPGSATGRVYEISDLFNVIGG